MPLNRLLLRCLGTANHYTENGVTCSISGVAGVRVVFICLDENSQEVRPILGMTADDKLCDVLAYLISERKATVKRALCLVECKVSEEEEAYEQLENTRLKLRAKLPQDLQDAARWLGAVVCKKLLATNPLKGGKSPIKPPKSAHWTPRFYEIVRTKKETDVQEKLLLLAEK